MSINAIGATVTAVVAVVVGVTKFALGAWVVLVLLPFLVVLLLGIRRHFHDVADQVTVDPNDAAEHPDTFARGTRHELAIAVPTQHSPNQQKARGPRSRGGGIAGLQRRGRRLLLEGETGSPQYSHLAASGGSVRWGDFTLARWPGTRWA